MATQALGQGALLQGGPWQPGHLPQYVGQGSAQAVVQDGGGAGGGAVGVNPSEIGITARGTGSPPFVGQGTGPFGAIDCRYDGPTNAAAGYHYLCLSPNAQGGGLITYGYGGLASPLPLSFIVNGVTIPLGQLIPGLFVGTTAVSGGSNGCVLSDNAGILSCVTILPTATARVRLTTSTAFLVSPTGSNSNSCLAVGQECLTIQHAYDVLANNYDLNGHDALISVADGAYAAGLHITSPLVGTGHLILAGNNAAPGNVTVTSTGADAFAIDAAQQIQITGFKCVVVTTGNCLEASSGGVIVSNSMEFGAAAFSQLDAGSNSLIFMNAPYKISGSANSHAHAGAPNSFILIAAGTVTITNSPVFTYFAGTNGSGGNIWAGGNTWSGGGTVTGLKFLVHFQSQVQVGSGDINYLPGNAAGILEGDGLYVGSSVYQGLGAHSLIDCFDDAAANLSFRPGLDALSVSGNGIGCYADGGFNTGAAINGSSTKMKVANADAWTLDSGRHPISTTTVPVLSSCGTSPVIAGSDAAGTLTEGSAASGCTMKFGVAWGGNGPSCVVTSRDGLVFTYAVTALVVPNDSLTITNVGALSSKKLDYHCTAGVN